EREPTNQRDQHDPGAGPDRVGDTDRNGAQRQRQHEEGERVAGDDHDGRREPAEALGGLERGRGDHLGDDGDREVSPLDQLAPLTRSPPPAVRAPSRPAPQARSRSPDPGRWASTSPRGVPGPGRYRAVPTQSGARPSVPSRNPRPTATPRAG